MLSPYFYGSCVDDVVKSWVIQRKDAGAVPERAVYHSGTLDANSLAAGEKDFGRKAETYMIMITEHDVLGRLVSTRSPLGKVRRFGCDPMGRQAWAMRPSGAMTFSRPSA